MRMRSFEWVRALAAPLILVSLAGCQQGGDDLVRVEPNSLGIAYVQIDHRTADGDRFLEVRGLNDDGEELARATLRTGMVQYPPAAEVMSPGTQLDLSVGEANQAYVSPDREPHENPEPDAPSIAAFTRLTAVSSAIMDEAGIWFRRRDLEGEVSYTAAACYGPNHPNNGGATPSSPQCCQEVHPGGEDYVWQKIGPGYGANVNKLARRYIEANTNPCRTSGGSTGCGLGASPCTYGPCAARVGSILGTNTTAAAVFTPTSDPTRCGADSNGAAAGGGVETPEPYSSQPLKPGVTATCPNTVCRTDGTPGNGVTLIADCSGSGGGGSSSQVYFGSNSVSCTGTQKNTTRFWSYNATTQYVIAAPGSGLKGTFATGCPGSNTNQGGKYFFNESAGSSTANDSLGNNDTGTVVAPAAIVTGASCQAGWGNCMDLKTGDGYVSFNSGSEMNFAAGSSFAVFGYIKTTDTYGAIISMRSSTDNGPIIDLAVGYDGAEADPGKAMTLVRQDGGTTGWAHVKGGLVNDNVWHRVEVRRNTAGSIELFVDSVSQGTSSGTQSGGAITTNQRRIGQEWFWETNNPGGPYSRLTGIVDEVYVLRDCLPWINNELTVEVDFTP